MKKEAVVLIYITFSLIPNVSGLNDKIIEQVFDIILNRSHKSHNGLYVIPDCHGQADVVIAIPGAKVQVPQKEFVMYEDFLIDMVNYYDVSKINTNVGLIIYGTEPVVITPLDNGLDKRDVFTRISLMAQRELYHHMKDGLNVVKAIDSIIMTHSLSKRPKAPKIGVILTYGGDDLSGRTPKDITAAIKMAGLRAQAAGINMFAVTAGGPIPGFQHLAVDKCRMFNIMQNNNLVKLMPYLASGTCYVFDPKVGRTRTKCFPVVLPRKPLKLMKCPPPTSGFFPDKNNCAYFLQCTGTKRYRTRCAGGTLYDPNIKSCNHKEFVTCYSKLKCPQMFGLFNHPHDCGKYLNCFGGVPYVQSCPAGLYFNADMKYCDYKHNVVCMMGKKKTHKSNIMGSGKRQFWW